MDSAEPVMTAGFSFSYPTTEIVIGGKSDFTGKWYIIDKNGNRTDTFFLIEKNDENSYTFTAFYEGLANGPQMTYPVLERGSNYVLVDAPDNMAPIRWTLTDSDHMDMSGVNVIANQKIVGTFTWNLVRD